MKKILLLLFLFLVLTNNVFALEEFVFQRTYNQKVYELEGNKKKYEIHSAHINYKDNNGDFQPINTTLTYNETAKSWEHNKASYQPKIPLYSDEWFEFQNNYEGTNHTLKAKPICSHVKGEYFKGEDGNGVLYKDAFGKGIDLKVYSYWAGLKKVIIVNEKPEDLKTALTFDFELELPSKEEVVNNKTSKISAKVIDTKTSAEWVKSEALDFKGKDLKIGLDNKYSYFRDALMWDSSGITEKVNIQLYQKDGKTYLRKTIPVEFLEKATFPIYTDHPTSYYAGAGDGFISSSNASWDTMHDSSTGNINYTGAYLECRTGKTNVYTCTRSFLPIDTSGIDDTATITEAILKISVYSKTNTVNDGTDWINVVQTSQAATNSLTEEDFDQAGSIDNPTEGATRLDITSISGTGYNSFTLNATGISWISKTGYSKLGLREGHDATDAGWSGSNYSYNTIYARSSEYTDTSSDPYLDITVSGGEAVVLKRRIMMFEDY